MGAVEKGMRIRRREGKRHIERTREYELVRRGQEGKNNKICRLEEAGDGEKDGVREVKD